MNIMQTNVLRAALLAACASLPVAPVYADETPAAAVPQRIVLPAMRAGGIPQGQILQITDRGSEMIAAPRITLASAETRVAPAVVAAAPKPAPRLFCAGTM